jgi:hypothetical protein
MNADMPISVELGHDPAQRGEEGIGVVDGEDRVTVPNRRHWEGQINHDTSRNQLLVHIATSSQLAL